MPAARHTSIAPAVLAAIVAIVPNARAVTDDVWRQLESPVFAEREAATQAIWSQGAAARDRLRVEVERGGVDKRCQLALRTDGGGPVVVSSVAGDWRSALDRALARATRFLLRQARRGQDFRKLRQRARAQETEAA